MAIIKTSDDNKNAKRIRVAFKSDKLDTRRIGIGGALGGKPSIGIGAGISEEGLLSKLLRMNPDIIQVSIRPKNDRPKGEGWQWGPLKLNRLNNTKSSKVGRSGQPSSIKYEMMNAWFRLPNKEV